PHEKAMQRALIQYQNPAMYDLAKEALVKAGREDLIGFGPKCLLRPEKGSRMHEKTGTVNHKGQNKKTGKKRTIRNIHKRKHEKK
ncbi:MAG: DUF3362 domain-containing protein, partial [Lachnospiraceae bacterium]|nr:DUF3362 domain-containing protein [Lachnospiraceae bacterium]